MSEPVTVDVLVDRPYPVIIGRGLLDDLTRVLTGRHKVAILHQPVLAQTAEAIRSRLAEAGIDAHRVEIPDAEAGKELPVVGFAWEVLGRIGIGRKDAIVSLGGGAATDVAGFVAATWLRGIDIVHVPTTLLGMVDAAVGGKTGINTDAGKNLVGAFHQPAYVLIDPDTLDTLPERQLAAGYAEVAKYGLIDDPAFFAWCEANGAQLIAGDTQARAYAIATSVAAKARIVAEDERETSGRRALLNLGHTFGHALEIETGFSDRLLHGEGVACGMALAFRFSAAQGLCPTADADRVTRHLAAVGLPTTLAAAGVDADGATLVAHMAHDKKMAGGRLPFLLARAIGETFVAKDVDLGAVAAFLDAER
jgi:3-dehydroquinate synthase